MDSFIGHKKKPLTISSSQCHIPHIEIILVIMKFESRRPVQVRAWKPKHELRFNFNTFLSCPGLLSELKLRNSLYFPPSPPPRPPLIVEFVVSARNCKLRCDFKCLRTACKHLFHLLDDTRCCARSLRKSYGTIIWCIAAFCKPQWGSPHLQIWCILTGWEPKSNKVQIIPWSGVMSFHKMTHINNHYHIW